MTHHTVASHTQLIATVDAIIGFRPTASLAVVGLGGIGPTARVDLPDVASILGVAASLSPALRHWRQGRVAVIVYGVPDVQAAVLAHLGDVILPGVTVALVLGVDGAVVSDSRGDVVDILTDDMSTGSADLDARQVVVRGGGHLTPDSGFGQRPAMTAWALGQRGEVALG